MREPAPVVQQAFPWRRAVTGLALAVLGTAVLLYFAGRSGGTLDNPVGSRAWEVMVTAIAVALLGVGLWQSFRAGRLSRVLLVVVATGSAFWQETYLVNNAAAEEHWAGIVGAVPQYLRCQQGLA